MAKLDPSSHLRRLSLALQQAGPAMLQIIPAINPRTPIERQSFSGCGAA